MFFINKKLVSNIVVVAGARITNLSQKFNNYGYYIYRDKKYRDKFFYDAFISAKTEYEAENILQKYNNDLCDRILLYLEEINSRRRSQGLDIIVFDLILTPTSWFTIKSALKLKKIRGIPLISTLHVNERTLQQIESFQLPWSNLILKYDVLTKQESDFLIAKNRDILIDISQYNNNVLEINNDIIIKRDSFQLYRQNSVVYVGRLSFEKGIDRLLAIAKLLKELKIDLHIC